MPPSSPSMLKCTSTASEPPQVVRQVHKHDRCAQDNHHPCHHHRHRCSSVRARQVCHPSCTASVQARQVCSISSSAMPSPPSSMLKCTSTASVPPQVARQVYKHDRCAQDQRPPCHH